MAAPARLRIDAPVHNSKEATGRNPGGRGRQRPWPKGTRGTEGWHADDEHDEHDEHDGVCRVRSKEKKEDGWLYKGQGSVCVHVCIAHHTTISIVILLPSLVFLPPHLHLYSCSHSARPPRQLQLQLKLELESVSHVPPQSDQEKGASLKSLVNMDQ
jgi:hypothetical protein